MARNNDSVDAICPCGSERRFRQCHGRPARRTTASPIAFAVVLVVSILVLVVVLKYGNAGKAAETGPVAAQRVTNYASIPGLQLQVLQSEEQTRLINHLNHTPCSCDCNMTVAECRNLDPSCAHSKEIAEANLGQLTATSNRLSEVAAQPAH